MRKLTVPHTRSCLAELGSSSLGNRLVYYPLPFQRNEAPVKNQSKNRTSPHNLQTVQIMSPHTKRSEIQGEQSKAGGIRFRHC